MLFIESRNHASSEGKLRNEIRNSSTTEQSNLFELNIRRLQDDPLVKEKMRLEALRQREEDRAKRFMNAKRRSIGVDKDALDRQVEEKRLREIAAGQEKLRDGELSLYRSRFIFMNHELETKFQLSTTFVSSGTCQSSCPRNE